MANQKTLEAREPSSRCYKGLKNIRVEAGWHKEGGIQCILEESGLLDQVALANS